ncbi:MAG TPA: hypothetical protein VKV04_22535 [Verrucomicrobiae bacterium]|nr:hypothetical protein [Verrucomicrobiae bacterium]
MAQIHYKNCTSDEVLLLRRFEPQIQRAATVRGVTQDISWEAYDLGGNAPPGIRYFRLFVVDRPDVDLGGDYGDAFLQKTSLDNFYAWITGGDSAAGVSTYEPVA